MRGLFSHGLLEQLERSPPEDSLKNSYQKASGGQEPLDVFFVRIVAALLGAVVQRKDLPAGRGNHGDQ